MTEDEAAKICYIAKQFKISADTFVTYQKEGEGPVRIRLDELLKQFENKSGQGELFEP